MQPEQVRTAADARAIVEERGLSHVKVGVFDNDGVLRGKYMDREKFFGALDKGFGFCDVVLGWDSNDQLYDNVKYTGWHTAYPDAPVRVLPASCRELPLEGNMLFFLGEFAEAAESVCPRAVLRRVLARAEKLGFGVSAAAEFEFFMFRETPESVRDKGYRGLQDADAGLFRLLGAAQLGAQRVLPRAAQAVRGHALPDRGPAHRDRARRARGRDPVLRGARGRRPRRAVQDLHQGAGAAQRHDGDLHGQVVEGLARARAATCTSRCRTARTARRCSTTPSAAARHVARDALVPRRAAGADARGAGDGGLDRQQLLAPDAGLLGADVGDLGRREPHHGAARDPGRPEVASASNTASPPPTSIRTSRSPRRSAPGCGASSTRSSRTPAVEGNAYERKFPAKRQLPRTLTEAAEWLAKSKPARELFGDAFVEHYAASREWEEREFRRAITDWELARYFEII